MSVRIVVGLGNPGEEYIGTRHNTGRHLIECFCAFHKGTWQKEKKLQSDICKLTDTRGDVFFVKPNVFMNDSGSPLKKVCQFYKVSIDSVVVVYDDIAFKVGDFRITYRSGTGGHNGVADILEKNGPGFVRFRIGIGAKNHPDMTLRDHVLGHFSRSENEIIEKMLPEFFNSLQLLLDKDK